jgi:hypothetical protein
MAGTALASPQHPVLTAYVARHALDPSAFLADGSLSLIVDAAYRVQVRPFPGERLVMQALLLDVSRFETREREDILVSLLRYAAATVRGFAAGLALDAASSWLVLQQALSPPIDVRRLETELTDFVSVQAFWREHCAQEVKRRHA